MSGVNSGWLPTNEPGYFGIGYDPWQSSTVPCWTCNENLDFGEKSDYAAFVGVAAQWVLEGVEVEGKRWVDIYFTTDDGKMDPDVFIRIGVQYNAN